MDVPSYLQKTLSVFWCNTYRHSIHPSLESRDVHGGTFRKKKTFDGTSHPFYPRSSCIDRSRHRISAMPLSVHRVINLHLCACPILLRCRRDQANKGRGPKPGGISVHYGMTVYRIGRTDLNTPSSFTKVSLQRCQVLPFKLLK